VAFFQLGGVVLSVYGRAHLAKDAGLSPGRAGFGGIALAQNVRSKQEVDAVLAEAEKAGGRIIASAGEKFWGVSSDNHFSRRVASSDNVTRRDKVRRYRFGYDQDAG
jgi:hypothetical protein